MRFVLCICVLLFPAVGKTQTFDDAGWRSSDRQLVEYRPQPVKTAIRYAAPHGMVVGIDAVRAEVSPANRVVRPTQCSVYQSQPYCQPQRFVAPPRYAQPSSYASPGPPGPTGPQGPPGPPGPPAELTAEQVETLTQAVAQRLEDDRVRVMEIDYDALAQRVATILRRDLEDGDSPLALSHEDPQELAKAITPYLPAFALTIDGRKRSAPLGETINLGHQRKMIKSGAQSNERTNDVDRKQ